MTILTRCNLLFYLAMISAMSGCGLRMEPEVSDLVIVIPNGYRGYFVLVQRPDKSPSENVIRVEVAADGFGEYRSRRNTLEVRSVKYADGTVLKNIDDLPEGQIGYRWICTTAAGEDWVFVGSTKDFDTSRADPADIVIRGHIHQRK